MFDFPKPRAKDKQINSDVLDNVVASGDLEFLHHLNKYPPLMGQPKHGAYVIAVAGKWT